MGKEELYKGKTIKVSVTIHGALFGWSADIDGAQVLRANDLDHELSPSVEEAIAQGLHAIKDKIDREA